MLSSFFCSVLCYSTKQHGDACLQILEFGLSSLVENHFFLFASLPTGLWPVACGYFKHLSYLLLHFSCNWFVLVVKYIFCVICFLPYMIDVLSVWYYLCKLKLIPLLFTNLQGVSKGVVAERILASAKERGKQADFVLCIGDDRSDEDMFENIADVMKRNIVAPRTALFACTVGQKPSKAKFYLDDTFEVVTMLSALADATGQLEADSADELAASISSLDIGDEQSEYSDKPTGGS